MCRLCDEGYDGFPIAEYTWQPSRWQRFWSRLWRRKLLTADEAMEAVNAYHAWDSKHR